MTVIRGVGVAIPLRDRADSARDLAAELDRLAREMPAAMVVRNQEGNLAIISSQDGAPLRLQYHGRINVLTGEVEMFDAPWRTAA